MHIGGGDVAPPPIDFRISYFLYTVGLLAQPRGTDAVFLMFISD